MTTDLSPVDLATARDRLRQLIIDLAVVRGKVTLASGIEADYYVDLRRVTLHLEASRYVGQVMLALLDEAGISCDAVGGLTMGADPVGHAIMRTAGDQGRPVDTFVVRTITVPAIAAVTTRVRLAPTVISPIVPLWTSTPTTRSIKRSRL